MRFARVSLLILLLPFLTPSLYAADIEAGEKRAAQCFGCHGADGISLNPLYPNLGGQSAEYLIKQLNAFRSLQPFHNLFKRSMIAAIYLKLLWTSGVYLQLVI